MNDIAKQLEQIERMIQASKRSLQRYEHELAMKRLDIEDIETMKINEKETIETMEEAKNQLASGNEVPDHVYEGVFGADFGDD